MLYNYGNLVAFTINIPQMLVYIPYMDPMGIDVGIILELSTQPGAPVGTALYNS
jgi:hypothetical protein